MKSGKQIVFRYNNDPSMEEIDLDMDDEKSLPEQVSIIKRKGERWKVTKLKWSQARLNPSRSPFIECSSPTTFDVTVPAKA